MKMDKLWIMFFVIAAGILYVSANAFAQVYSEECLDCSVCEVFEELKQECIDVYNTCVNHNLPDDICGEISEYCEGHLEDTIVSCRKLCRDDCDEQEPQNCTGGAPNTMCEIGENCPPDASSCDDNICMEPTCTNGCGEVPVSSGSTDEACNATAGCTTPPCSCDGSGGCTGENETCNGGQPDGNCEDNENCPADAADCDDNICMEPTCIDGCGETPVPEGETDEACGPNGGCTTSPCSCDGNGNCATVPTNPDCHGHGNPSWLEFHSLSTVLAKEKGCTTTNCGTEYLVELRDKSHADCGDQAWVWLKGGPEMDIDKCYDARVFEDSAPCGSVIYVPPESVSCPDCDVSEECQIRITFDKDEYCPHDSIVMKVEFIDDGDHVDFTTISIILKKPNNEEIDLFTHLEKVDTGIYEARGIIGSAGERTLEVEAQFGNCQEDASESYTVHSADSPECQGGGGGTECDVTTTFDREHYCTGDHAVITTEFRNNNALEDPKDFGAMITNPSKTIDITDYYNSVSTGIYVFEGIAGIEGRRTLYISAYFENNCHAQETGSFFVYSREECPEEEENSCSAQKTMDACLDYSPGGSPGGGGSSGVSCSCGGTGYKTYNIGGDTIYVDCLNDKCWTQTLPGRYHFDDANRKCEDLEWGGVSDWTLPDAEVLLDLCNSDSCSGTCFDNDGDDFTYWSSTGLSSTEAKGVFFALCSETATKSKTFSRYVRCVMTGDIPQPPDQPDPNDLKCYWDQETDSCKSYRQLCSDPDGGKNYDVQAHTYGFRKHTANERDARIRTGGKDACISGKLREHYCVDSYHIETIDVSCPAGSECRNGACKSGSGGTKCEESDGGIDPYVKGTISKGTEVHTDVCVVGDPANTIPELREYFCVFESPGGDGEIYHSVNPCPAGFECRDGACKSGSGGTCTEYGGGNGDHYNKGYIILSDGTKLEDHCMTGAYEKHVMEYWCTTDGHGQGNFPCPDGCENGACKSSGGGDEWCDDDDVTTAHPDGINYGLKGKCTDWRGASKQDRCVDGKLVEYYCIGTGCGSTIHHYECPTGQKCENGACVDDAGSGTCTEYGGGNGDHYNKGYIILSDGTKLEDHCMTGAYEKHVMEYWCTTDGHGQGNFPCPDGCENGACVD